MKRFAGQAGRVVSQLFAGAGMLIMTLFFLAVLGAGALAYRLSQGPMQIPWLAAKLANAASGEDVQVKIGQASLAWAGYKSGSLAPLYLDLADMHVRNAEGAEIATIPQAQLAFSLGGLFRHGVPIYISGGNAHVMGWAAPVSLLAGIRLGAALTLSDAEIWITLGAGQLGPPGFSEPIQGGKFLLEVTPGDFRLSQGTLTLTPYGQSAPTLHIQAAAHKTNAWHGAITLSADAVQAPDLYHYWPEQAVPLTRHWVTENITGGTAKNASFTLGLSAPLHLASVHLDSAAGGFAVENGTLAWMPGVMPLTKLEGTFKLTDADDIDITATTGQLGQIQLTNGKMHIAGVSQPDQTATLDVPVSATVQQTFAVLGSPGLDLMKSVPAPVAAATGNMTGTVKLTMPMQGDISTDTVQLTVTTALADVVLPLPVQGLTLQNGALAVTATLHDLTVTGDAQLAGEKASLKAAANFSAAKGAPVSLQLNTIATNAMLKQLGWDLSSYIQGPMPLAVHVATANKDGSFTVKADLTQASMSLPFFGWQKPAGKPGQFAFAAHINGDQFSGISRIDSITAKAPGLDIQTAIDGDTITLNHAQIGDTEGSGKIVPPAAHGQPWQVTLSGNALDLTSLLKPANQSGAAKPKASHPHPPTGPLWNATLHFGRLVLAGNDAPALENLDFSGSGQGGFLFTAGASADVDAGKPVTLTITQEADTAPGEAETVQLTTEDGGTLLRATGIFNDLEGGELDLFAHYGIGLPTMGETRLTHYRVLNAPAMGKILQAVTLLGIPAAASGPGLEFTRLIAPFSIEDQVLTLKEARAYSASLGFTASGTIDLNADIYDLHGTIVPAYALNTLPGKIPLIGKLFSPEKGGGLFAMRYSITGPMADPKVKVNPLSALTPGFLRGIFGAGKKPEAAK